MRGNRKKSESEDETHYPHCPSRHNPKTYSVFSIVDVEYLLTPVVEVQTVLWNYPLRALIIAM